MPNIVLGNRNSDWLELTHQERENEPLSRVFDFFPRRDSLYEHATISIRNFLNLILKTTSDNSREVSELGIAALLALDLPNFILKCLRQNLNEVSNWYPAREEMPKVFRTNHRDQNFLISYLTSFSRKFDPDFHSGFRSTDDKRTSEVIDSVWHITHDADFVALATTGDGSIKSMFDGLDSSVHIVGRREPMIEPGVTSRGLDVIAEDEFDKYRIKEEDTPDSAASKKALYVTTQLTRQLARAESEAAYAALSNTEAWEMRGKKHLPYIVLSYAGLFWCLLSSIFGKSLMLISLAHAQASQAQGASQVEGGLSHPPLGLNPIVWQCMSVVFFLWVIATLSVFLWKGYLAKEKSETAADTVKNLLVMGIGLFFGKVVSG